MLNEELTKLIKQNKNLIYSIINYFPNFQNKEDLFQVGCIGLIKAYQRFDKHANIKFSTYAYNYIIGEIKKYIREDKSIKISREISLLNYRINKAIILLSQKLMREPTIKELASFLEIDEYYISEALNALNPVQSLDETLKEDDTFSLYEVIPSKDGENDDYLILKESISKLNKDEQKLIELRYYENRTQTEVASYFNTNQTGISREEKKILVKLRNSLSA